MCFVAVMVIPMIYYFFIPVWLCKRWTERFQFWLGCLMYIFCGPFINIAVLCYAVWNMDSFGWGKTRKVIVEPEVGSGMVIKSEKVEHVPATTGAVVNPFLDPVERPDIGDEEKNVGL